MHKFLYQVEVSMSSELGQYLTELARCLEVPPEVLLASVADSAVRTYLTGLEVAKAGGMTPVQMSTLHLEEEV